MVNLEQLQQEIVDLGETIKALKASSDGEDNKAAVAKAVASLLEAKKTYAANNNGIGFDGQPYEEPLTKAQKKAKAKAEAATAAATADQVASAAAAADSASGKQVCGIYMVDQLCSE